MGGGGGEESCSAAPVSSCRQAEPRDDGLKPRFLVCKMCADFLQKPRFLVCKMCADFLQITSKTPTISADRP